MNLDLASDLLDVLGWEDRESEAHVPVEEVDCLTEGAPQVEDPTKASFRSRSIEQCPPALPAERPTDEKPRTDRPRSLPHAPCRRQQSIFPGWRTCRTRS
jgi:hypothetical protein